MPARPRRPRITTTRPAPDPNALAYALLDLVPGRSAEAERLGADLVTDDFAAAA